MITKGVGFLPLLALIPFVAAGAPRLADAGAASATRAGGSGRSSCSVAIALWFVPMMLATSAGGELLAYRNEILFKQTVTRYADAWHHHEPFWFYLVNVIPVLWLPLIALVPWLWPRWRAALRGTRTRWSPCCSRGSCSSCCSSSLSSGKRGVYVLPAVPALAMAAAPWLPELLRRTRAAPARVRPGRRRWRRSRRWRAVYFAVDGKAAARIVRDFGLSAGAAARRGGAAAARSRSRCSACATAGSPMRACSRPCCVTIGFVVYPRIDAVRSGRALHGSASSRRRAGIAELGLVGAKEQYLLELRRPSVNFGHARWREREAEAADDAAAWLAAAAGSRAAGGPDARARRALQARAVDRPRTANRQHWFLVWGHAGPGLRRSAATCVAARLYVPPNACYKYRAVSLSS